MCAHPLLFYPHVYIKNVTRTSNKVRAHTPW